MDIIAAVRELSLDFPSVQRVVLFGSRARGDCDEKSDYDIAVFGCKSDEQALFRSRVNDMNTLYKIDLIFIGENHRGTKLYENIIRDGVVIMDKFLHKLENYKNAVERLRKIINNAETENWDGIQDAVIKRFEFTEELAWKTAREYLLSEGFTDINSPKSVMRTALSAGLISDEKGWAALLENRNDSAHVYDESLAEEICGNIKTKYIFLFSELLSVLEEKKSIYESDL